MFTITHIDTACMLIDINGYKILTDPTLDDAGKLYYHGSGAFSRKTGDPALPMTALPVVDLVLLSHHHHKDNFDTNGKKFASTVPLVLSTKPAARAIKGIIGLNDWETYSIHTTKVPGLKITATPAQHHPWWVPGVLAGKVIGFIIAFDKLQDGVVYISGDTVYFRGIDEIAKRYRIHTAIFHVGSVQFRYISGFGQYTMSAKGMLKSVHVLKPGKVIPVHYKGWSHFKESESTLRSVLARDSFVNEKVTFLTPGIPTWL